jgi:hypothetical protein
MSQSAFLRYTDVLNTAASTGASASTTFTPPTIPIGAAGSVEILAVLRESGSNSSSGFLRSAWGFYRSGSILTLGTSEVQIETIEGQSLIFNALPDITIVNASTTVTFTVGPTHDSPPAIEWLLSILFCID